MSFLSIAIGFLFSFSDGRLHSYFYSSKWDGNRPNRCTPAFLLRTVVETSRLRLSTHSHVGATSYVYWSLCSSSQLRATSARASSRNWYQLCSKPSRRIALRNARKAPAPRMAFNSSPRICSMFCARENRSMIEQSTRHSHKEQSRETHKLWCYEVSFPPGLS